ncbi:MAG TPA: hypothetical protein VE863_19665 [Pyrinomonadaceae bacterium]|jgi:hypothetical protein|nr:hypothetical protein [Pyrinomonadaceae bacterium]
MAEIERARELLRLDRPQLFALLAQGSPEYTAAAQADFSPREFGERIFETMRDKLNEVVCPHYCSSREHWLSKDSAELVVVVAGWLDESLVGYPILTISVILVKSGLHVLCDCK